MSLQPFVSLYQFALTPIAPFTWFGLNISSLEIAAAFRLCYVLRYIRDNLRNEHSKRRVTDKTVPAHEERSFTRDALTTLLVVYGGEAIAAPLLGVPASFMVSGVSPLLYILMTAIVEAVPTLPDMSLTTELPLSFMDGHARAVLLCSLVPPVVLSSSSPAVASSPWALLIASFLITNGGFILTNLTSLLHPTTLTLTTPPELTPYGWTTTDLWSAPLITGLYATLTHAQPFWADLHAVLSGMLGDAGVSAGADGKVASGPGPLDKETARAACALVLSLLFASRTAQRFGLTWKKGIAEKIKTN